MTQRPLYVLWPLSFSLRTGTCFCDEHISYELSWNAFISFFPSQFIQNREEELYFCEGYVMDLQVPHDQIILSRKQSMQFHFLSMRDFDKLQ